MAFDPVSTFLAAALYAPIVLNSSRGWRPTGTVEKPVSVWIETDRPVIGAELETTRLLSKPYQLTVPDRLTALFSEIDQYAVLPQGWDGPRSNAPSERSITAARNFVEAFPAGLPLPIPMISSSGEVGFYWNEDGGYADMSFDSDGVGSFFSQDRNGEERYIDGVTPNNYSRAWFFDQVGGIAAPVDLAA